jgi:hypothetical protein
MTDFDQHGREMTAHLGGEECDFCWRRDYERHTVAIESRRGKCNICCHCSSLLTVHEGESLIEFNRIRPATPVTSISLRVDRADIWNWSNQLTSFAVGDKLNGELLLIMPPEVPMDVETAELFNESLVDFDLPDEVVERLPLPWFRPLGRFLNSRADGWGRICQRVIGMFERRWWVSGDVLIAFLNCARYAGCRLEKGQSEFVERWYDDFSDFHVDDLQLLLLAAERMREFDGR